MYRKILIGGRKNIEAGEVFKANSLWASNFVEEESLIQIVRVEESDKLILAFIKKHFITFTCVL